MKKVPFPTKFRIHRQAALMARVAIATLCIAMVFGCQATPMPANAPAQVSSASTKPEVTSTAQDVKTNTATAQVEHQEITLDLTLSGEYVHGFPIKDAASQKVVMDAVFNYMIKSSAWPGVDISTRKDYIAITIKYNEKDTEYSLYYVFDKDGKHCMQTGKDGMYSTISDEVYEPLKDLAMGYSLPHAMTIVSGGNTIHAVQHLIQSRQNKDGLPADMKYLTPQQMADHIQYLRLDPDREGLSPFTLFFNNEKVYGTYILYNDKFQEIPFLNPSALEPQTYLFRNANPGKYIVELQTISINEMESLSGQYLLTNTQSQAASFALTSIIGYQYFFGVIVP
jgi:hypothetical protein